MQLSENGLTARCAMALFFDARLGADVP